jgi:cyanophycinase
MPRSRYGAAVPALHAVLLVLVSCGSDRAAEPTGRGGSPRPGNAADDGSRPGAPPRSDGDGGVGDGAVAAVACTPSSAITIFPPVGGASDDTRAPGGPGLVLMGGGTDVDAAFTWTHDTIAGSASGRAGDLVVLRASGDNAYDQYAYDLSAFHSVRTVVIGAAATNGDLACAAAIIARAEGVFFAGGDQSKYFAWKGSALMAAVQALYDRGGVIGGTSAGCAILGGFAYDAAAAGPSNVTTADAIADPFESGITFTRGMLAFPPLAGAITDPHFRPRDRMGRLAAFMARQHADGAVARMPAAVMGIGVDEKSAVVIDKNGVARLLQQVPGSGSAFFVRGGAPDQCVAGSPLIYRKLLVTRLDSSTQTFSLASWCGSGTVYTIDVFGDSPPPYQPSNPYAAMEDGSACLP